MSEICRVCGEVEYNENHHGYLHKDNWLNWHFFNPIRILDVELPESFDFKMKESFAIPKICRVCHAEESHPCHCLTNPNNPFWSSHPFDPMPEKVEERDEDARSYIELYRDYKKKDAEIRDLKLRLEKAAFILDRYADDNPCQLDPLDYCMEHGVSRPCKEKARQAILKEIRK